MQETHGECWGWGILSRGSKERAISQETTGRKVYGVCREVLAGSESWCPSGLQLPRVLELDLHSDAYSMPCQTLAGSQTPNESQPGALVWKMHSFKPSHPSAAKGLGIG